MATSATSSASKQLTLLGFFAITASMVMAVYEYPTFATSGFSLVFFLLLGGLLWFIPVALCAAEMATVEGWQEGGVFAWVSNTLGGALGICGDLFWLFTNSDWFYSNALFRIRSIILYS